LMVLSPEERAEHIGLTGRLFSRCSDFLESADGFEFQFDHSVLETDIERWIENEQKCCKFATYESISGTAGPKLIIRTGESGRDFLRQLYSWLLAKELFPVSLQQTDRAKSGILRFGVAAAVV